MGKLKELRVTIDDKPGALGRCFAGLADRGVNILAFQSYVEEGESLTRFVVNDIATARDVLGELHMNFEVTDVAVAKVPNRPGELGHASSLLGEQGINIDYSYCGLDPDSGLVMLVFGVDSLTKAATVLDKLSFVKS